MGIGTILKLTLALMTASLFVSVSTFGDLGSAITDGMDNIQDATDFTVEVDNIQTLSDAAKFVRQRAGNNGCAETNNKDFNTVPQQNSDDYSGDGYPALRDEYMGQYPSCSGTSSTLVRGLDGAAMDEGQDMEGIYSRVRFEVTEPIAIVTSENATEYQDTWLENRLVGATHLSLQEATLATKQACKDAEGSDAEFLGTVDQFVMFYAAQGAEEPARSDKWIRGFNQDELNNNFYCSNDGELMNYGQNDVFSEYLAQHPVTSATMRVENKYILCPGDRGYIQMNKDTPQTRAETGESVWSGSARNIPFIQITNLGTSEGSSCLPAEMAPAGKFTEVVNAERIELPAQAGDQIAATIPDKFENAYTNFIEDTWEDSFADKSLDWLENQDSEEARWVAEGVEGAIGALSDVATGITDALNLTDSIDTVGELLEEEGVDPLTDMAEQVTNAVVSELDSRMQDSLHIELKFANQHLDMNDDRFPADTAGGFQIRMYESGTDGGLQNSFEREPPAGVWFEDVGQGETDEMDALQQGWLDGNGGIDDLGCYVTAELFMKQKRDLPEGERAEDIWDIYIGDLGNGGSNTKEDCPNGRDGRLDGDRGGESWGGLATLEDIEITVEGYDSSNQILTVSATVTSNNNGDLSDGDLEIGLSEGYEDLDVVNWVNCPEENCNVEASISDVAPSDDPNVKARFIRDDETKEERLNVDMENYVDDSALLGEEHWVWDSGFNFTESNFNISVSYGYPEHEDQSSSINNSILSLSYVTEEAEEAENEEYEGGNAISSKVCEDDTYISHCSIDQDDVYPTGNLELNASISRNGAKEHDVRVFEVPFGNLEESFSSVYNATEENFDLNVTYSSDITLLDTDLSVMNITNESDITEIGEKDCTDSNSCKLELEDLKPGSSGSLEVNATLDRAGAKRHAVQTFTN